MPDKEKQEWAYPGLQFSDYGECCGKAETGRGRKNSLIAAASGIRISIWRGAWAGEISSLRNEMTAIIGLVFVW